MCEIAALAGRGTSEEAGSVMAARTNALLFALCAVATALQPPTLRTSRLHMSEAKGFAATQTDTAVKRKNIAKARRAVLADGSGGMTPTRTKKKRSEQKKAPSGKGFGKVTGGLNFDRRPSPNTNCACGSGKAYKYCCMPLHDGAPASSPADLVRARYCAYCYRMPDYLMSTTDPEGEEWNEDTAGWKRSLVTFCVRRRRARARALRAASAHVAYALSVCDGVSVPLSGRL